MEQAELHRLAVLIRSHRWAALGTQGIEGEVETSWVAYAPETDFSGFLMHLSRLAAHTRNLLQHPRAALAISEQERPDHDPQLLARVTILGEVEPIPRETPEHARCTRLYRERLPDSAPLFEFSDFLLLRLRPAKARFVSGFARAYGLDLQGLREAAAVKPLLPPDLHP